MKELICIHCNSIFNVKIKSGPVPKYCSNRCRFSRNKGYAYFDKAVRECKTCGKKYTPVKLKQKYCSLSCNHKGVIKDRKPTVSVPVNCFICGEKFTPKTNRGGPRLCSDKCKSMRYRKSETGKAQRSKNDRAQNHVRRARIRNATIEPVNLDEIYTRDNWLCGLCGGEINKNIKWPDNSSPSIDHVMPLSKGGHHIAANLQAAHLGCNVGKGNRA